MEEKEEELKRQLAEREQHELAEAKARAKREDEAMARRVAAEEE